MRIDAKSVAPVSPEVEAIINEVKTLVDGVYPLVVPVDPEFPVHTRLGTIEVFPGTMTPAAWAGSGSAISRITHRVAKELGIIPGEKAMNFQGVFYGCCATNISSYILLMRRLPGAPWLPWTASARAVIQPHADPITGWEPPPTPGAWIGDCIWRLRGWRKSRRVEADLQASVEPLEAKLREGEAELARRDFSALDVEALVEELKKPRLNAELVRLHSGVTLFVGSHYMKLVASIARYTSLPPIQTANGLLVAMGEVESAKPALALRAIAAQVRHVPRLASLLRAGEFGKFAEALQAPADDAERRVSDARNQFLKNYGYRGIGESTIDATTWGEDPGQADRLLALYLDNPGVQDSEAAARRRQALENEVLGQISNPSVRSRMQRYITSAQTFAALRERTKSMSVRQSLRTRRLLKALTDRLIEAGAFETAEDREMLSFRELTGALGMERSALRELIARRRKAYELLEKLDIVEETFAGIPTPCLARGEGGAVAEVGAVLSGLGISPGHVEGIARVIRDPRLAAVLKSGEILVAPYTDAAWSPLFILAAGVVINSATLISHGATVARELGLPAVANVPGTTSIQDGDRILVNGSTGEVTILARLAGQAPVAEASAAITPFVYEPERFAVLRSLRLKGRADVAAIAVSTALPPETIEPLLRAASDCALCSQDGDVWQMLPAGFAWVEENLCHDRPDPEKAEQIHNVFLPVNARFKQLAFDWQMRDPQTLNDHRDVAYDAAVLNRLESLHQEAMPVITEAGGLHPRLAPFIPRLDHALANIRRGEVKFLMSPRVDSYHSIWFEFHEELIAMTGRTRAEEAEAGRGA